YSHLFPSILLVVSLVSARRRMPSLAHVRCTTAHLQAAQEAIPSEKWCLNYLDQGEAVRPEWEWTKPNYQEFFPYCCLFSCKTHHYQDYACYKKNF
ncbi:hypothetical protein PMAYCL1PPCAC_05485, partial [Pristionchus mayeri]